MSHFTLIVIGENVDEQMAPYAEQDAEEKYLEFSDTEDQNLDEYKNKEVELVVLADGSLHHKYEEQFQYYTEGSYQSEWKYPEGSIIRQGKFEELFDSFESYMEQWHGNHKRDEKNNRYGYWYNPNAQYDWYN